MKQQNSALTFLILTVLTLSLFSGFGSSSELSINPMPNEDIQFKKSHVLFPNQVAENLSRPILEKVTFQNGSNVEVLRERNDTLGLGAVFRSHLNVNYTITYLVVNGTSDTLPLLHANLPDINATLDFNNKTGPKLKYVTSFNQSQFVLPYDPENPLINATIARYEITINMTVDYAIFYAEVNGISEDRDFVRNAFSTGVVFRTSSAETFYIQNENVTVVLEGKNFINTTYGVEYRTSSSDTFKTLNFTKITIVNSTLGTFNATLSLGDFTPGTTVEFRSIAYVNDTARNVTILLRQLDYSKVDVGDGTPELTTDLLVSHEFPIRNQTVYTNNGTIQLNVSASVPKGNITSLNITLIDTMSSSVSTNIVLANRTLFNTTLEMNTIYNISIIVETDKNLRANTTYRIITDDVAPTIASFSKDTEELNIARLNKTITFYFNFTDSHSGAEIASLSLGDNTTVEVTGLSSFTYTYKEFDSYEITLVVWDKAGNSVNSTILLTLVEPELPQQFALIDPVVTTIVLVLFVAVIAYLSYWYGRN